MCGRMALGLAVLLLLETSSSSQLRVCITLDSGFDMLLDASMPIADVSREDELYGFNVDARSHILPAVLGSNSSYSLRVLDSYGELMVAARRDECDVAWAAFFHTSTRDRCGATVTTANSCRPLSEWTASSPWTPWRCCVDFSPPFLAYGLAIMYEASLPDFYTALILSITSPFTINFGSFTFVLVCIIAHLVWLAERKHNATEFPTRYFDGIDDAFWWAIVTLTTVGYGDKVTKTAAGRLLGLLWMVIGLVLSSILVGAMASTFQDIRTGVSTLAGAPSLISADYTVCSYPTSFRAGEALANVPPRNRVERSSMAECAAWFQAAEGAKKAIVLDSVVMKHFRSITPWARQLVISSDINQYLVAVVYPEGGGQLGRSLSDRLNPAIVEFLASEKHAQLLGRWFPTEGAERSDVESYEWTVIVPALVLIVGYAVVMLLRESADSAGNAPEALRSLGRRSRVVDATVSAVASG